jgi:hypothetical protein
MTEIRVGGVHTPARYGGSRSVVSSPALSAARFFSFAHSNKLAAPSVPSVGSRAVYFPAQPPAPPNPTAPQGGVITLPSAFGTPPQPAPVVDAPLQGANGLPGIVLKPGTGSPDFPGTVLLCWDQNGNTYIRTGMISVTTWSGLGSPATIARWQLSDVLS